ncbi:MAG: hypothetical protein ACR2K1_04160 [Saprospiraceae bacterium]
MPFIDARTGLMAREWYRYFLNLFTLTGSGASTVSVIDFETVPPIVPPMDDNTGFLPPAVTVVVNETAANISLPTVTVSESQSVSAAPGAEYSSLADIAVLETAIAGLAVAPVYQPEVQHLHYGAFQDNTTQTAAAINTAYAVTFDTTDFESGVSRGTPTSHIVCQNIGVYNFQFSLQMAKSAAALGYAYVWARVNGTDVPDSATKLAFQGSNSETVAAWNFVLRMGAGDYFQLMWAVDDTAIELVHYASVAFAPAIPSAILTVTQVNL